MSSQKTKRQASKTTQCGQKRKHVQAHTIEQLVNIKAPPILDCIKHYRRWDAREIDLSLCDSEISLLYEDREHEVLVTAEMLEEKAKELGQKERAG
jgi:hypothetical protein